MLPCENRGSERRSWFVFVVKLPLGSDRNAVIAELGEQGVASKAYLPCIHLMPHYRERFGTVASAPGNYYRLQGWRR